MLVFIYLWPQLIPANISIHTTHEHHFSVHVSFVCKTIIKSILNIQTSILTEPTNETDLDMHEACISFFYNLIVAFELDNHVISNLKFNLLLKKRLLFKIIKSYQI